MENKVDIREIAQYCKNEYQQKCEKSDRKWDYSIDYVVIPADGKMKISKTPHILEGAEECYLIHRWQELASTIAYDTYEVQHINVDGVVEDGVLDNEYSFRIHAARFNCWARISLTRNGDELYCESLWSNGTYMLTKRLEYVFELYKMCKKECDTQYEAKLLCQLAKQKESFKDLEEELEELTVRELYLRKETAQYRNMLEEIASLLKPSC